MQICTYSVAVLHPVDEAAQILGGRAAMGALLGNLTATAIGNWIKRGVPLEQCIPIERATAGRVICERLRPDKAVDFAYLRNAPFVAQINSAQSGSQPPVHSIFGIATNPSSKSSEHASATDATRERRTGPVDRRISARSMRDAAEKQGRAGKDER